jgi:hypothetical protein
MAATLLNALYAQISCCANQRTVYAEHFTRCSVFCYKQFNSEDHTGSRNYNFPWNAGWRYVCYQPDILSVRQF